MMKPYWITGGVFLFLFAVLFSVRVELFQKIFSGPDMADSLPVGALPEKDTWMNIFQKDRKIGYSHTVFFQKENGYDLMEEVFMRINTMGLAQDLRLKTEATLNRDLTLSAFSFNVDSGRLFFSVTGEVTGNILSVTTHSSGAGQQRKIRLKEKPHIAAGILQAVINAGLGPGDRMVFNVFDPATMGQEKIGVEILEKEEMENMGITTAATKISLDFKGTTQYAWISENGDLLKESGLLGLTMERTSRRSALGGLMAEPSEDLTKAVSVKSNIVFADPKILKKLQVKISGINIEGFFLHGGRQILQGNLLTINKESPNEHKTGGTEFFKGLQKEEKRFLKPGAFIQSDHPEFIDLVQKILLKDDQPLEKVKKLVRWTYDKIEKRPVLSVPDALSTLKNRMGDCNEHAVLLAALSRAAGIPAKVESGLVYLDGRFYYHAWNSIYVGYWITADSLFNQIPADVTHIRFTSGGPENQLDLIRIIGNVGIDVMALD